MHAPAVKSQQSTFIELGSFHMSPVTGLARLPGQILKFQPGRLG